MRSTTSRLPVALLFLPVVLHAQALSPAKKDSLIQAAVRAAPADIGAHAAVVLPGPDGKMVTLRPGTNGFTCFPDNPETPGPDPMCADANAMLWGQAYMSHAAKPANTTPGVAYMLAGGSDVSNTDPYAKPGKDTKWIQTGPHWMLMWPMDPKTTGLPTTPSNTGAYIMWAGTPWAHVMINGQP